MSIFFKENKGKKSKVPFDGTLQAKEIKKKIYIAKKREEN